MLHLISPLIPSLFHYILHVSSLYINPNSLFSSHNSKFRTCSQHNSAVLSPISMEKFWNLTLLLSVLTSITVYSTAERCSSYQFSSNRAFESCNELPVLDSFLHYNYDASSGIMELAYRRTKVTTGRWVAWAVNPTSTGMVGSQAIVAYPLPDGTVRVYTSPIRSYQTTMQEGDLSFNVSGLSATYQDNEIVIFASLQLPGGTINTVWQDGTVSGNTPQPHSTSGDNVRSISTINLISGVSGAVGGGGSKLRKRNIHGVLNGVSWGIMMPMGAIIARYMRVFEAAEPAWFYLHAFCQASAYIIGVAGWATGLQLGAESAGIRYDTHRAIGITLFSLATLQAFALFLRPRPEHKQRKYWNIYHHTLGYGIIVLGVVNVFKGLGILSPTRQWRDSYIGIVVALAILALLLEAFTWYLVLKRRRLQQHSSKSSSRPDAGPRPFP
ncbi:PREDICTED: cytochrome b561 and DOMON domain-containing protein At4g17280 [Tarenaya hassleriana]|uniref:cytochrome b561 and DOMON domain-containing protein At4g17280 n=1 Tax=Tarenaya hassleriana TaxID=28532 RepID=UPI00053C5CCD|nr:PREDICTED: cytochrome b561 and DOMON domain-containing protein At4g17280 [Tarenaya hassleriana]